MTEPYYDGVVRAVHDGRDPPRPRRVHFFYNAEYSDVEGQVGTGELICEVFYGNTSSKDELARLGGARVDPVEGYQMNEFEEATHAFMRWTARNWQNRSIDQLYLIAEPV